MNLFKILKEKNRYDLVTLLERENLIGIELGVAGGLFSKKMINSGKFKTFFGVDKYSDHHDVNQYKSAIKYLKTPKDDIKATGGTNWKKYLPPKFQNIIFFPKLWTKKEKDNWGVSWVLENYK